MDELIIKEEQTRQAIEQVIVNSNLPAFILEPIFKDAHEQLLRLKLQQLNIAKENEQKRIEEEKKAKKKEEGKK